MAKRYIGDAVITIFYSDADDETYHGTVSANGHVWKFDDLRPPRCGFNVGYDSPEAYDRMASAAASFASYYHDGSSFADALLMDSLDNGEYAVRRSRNGKYVNAHACACGRLMPIEDEQCSECRYAARKAVSK